MNILYLYHFYRDGDGGSSAIDFFLQIDKPIVEDYLVVCKRKYTTKAINIVEECDFAVIDSFLSKPNIIIHYVRSGQSNVLEHILKHSKSQIPVITTVVQNPGYKRLMLSPFEIKHSNYFVFIDKSSYNHKIISFIPNRYRSCIYLMYSRNHKVLQSTESVVLSQNSNCVVYGRGSTLSKCPKDMFEVFDKIGIDNKIFRIVGIAEGDNWVRREAKKRANVEVFPQLKYDDWFKICKSFDVFLYQLPKDSYASIDGTLGLAMCMRKPVVYMGCDAPKERIEHGKNGYIAETIDEMAYYATELGRSYDLRKSIGEKGREGVYTMSKENNAEQRFHDSYMKAFQSDIIISVPLSYRLKYLFYCYKDIIRNHFNKY